MAVTDRSRKRMRNGGPCIAVRDSQTSPHQSIRGSTSVGRGQDHETIQTSTIHLKQSVRKELLWQLAILFLGFVTLPASAARRISPDRNLLQEKKQLADEHLRKLFEEELSNDCIDVIVTLASAHGNIDPILGLGDKSHYERTNAVAMPCISLEMHTKLLASPEVLLVEHDAPVHSATTTTTTTTEDDLGELLENQVDFENGEVIPWGADLVLQSSWEEIPDPDPNGDNFTICVVDSGLLVSHQDIVSFKQEERLIDEIVPVYC
jgi:hypothetical protein